MTQIALDKEVAPEDVQTPEQLQTFLRLLDKQVAEAGERTQDIVVAVGVRARGLTWAVYRAADIMAKLEQRIAELEQPRIDAERTLADRQGE